MQNQLQFANKENIPQLQLLLKTYDLPYEDIEKQIHNFILIKNKEKVIGCVGLEVYGEAALLRSLAVDEKYRNQGMGRILTQRILQYALSKQIKKVFLLTMTAEGFFRSEGFKRIERIDAPEAIRLTTEFASLCPDTAVLMGKEL